MQMVSREQLLSLLGKRDGIRESGAPGAFSYSEFLRVSHDALSKARAVSGADAVHIAYEILKNGWVKSHCPPIRHLGEGSSRLAMAIDGGKCLKIATSSDGVLQNENEVMVLQKGNGLMCFPKLHRYDKGEMLSLVADCCCEAKPEDFRREYGTSCVLTIGTVRQLVQDELDFTAARQYFKRCMSDESLAMLDDYENFSERLEFLDKLEKHKSTYPAWKSMWDLARFCASSPKMLSLYELEHEVNWGIAARDGALCPVVIDAGADEP